MSFECLKYTVSKMHCKNQMQIRVSLVKCICISQKLIVVNVYTTDRGLA